MAANVDLEAWLASAYRYEEAIVKLHAAKGTDWMLSHYDIMIYLMLSHYDIIIYLLLSHYDVMALKIAIVSRRRFRQATYPKYAIKQADYAYVVATESHNLS
jgi:hypothetical protein